jgi:hypothetical protein
MPELSFSVRAGVPALPGTLTIEIQSIPQVIQNKNPVILPPLREPVTGQPQTATGDAQASTGSNLMSRQWGINWATPVTRRLNALGGATNWQLLSFEAPSLDTTDMAWYATGTMDALTDPITITAPVTGTSIYDRTFSVGDYVIWDDSASVNGLYQYEINQITAVNGQVFTLSRSQQGARQGKSYFGAARVAHAGVRFYRMLDPTFNVLWDGSPQVFKFWWEQMIVSAVRATTVDVAAALVSLIPVPPAAAALGLTT